MPLTVTRIKSMALIRNAVMLFLFLAACAAGGFVYWSRQPISMDEAVIDFTVTQGSGVASAAQQIAAAGVPIDPTLFSMLARLTQNSSKIKAGTYELKPGTTPMRLVEQLVRGEFAQESLTIIEGWTFKQMRQAIAANKGLKHDTAHLTDRDLMQRISTEFKHPEGLFFPDTYLFAKGASDLQVYRQAHQMLINNLTAAWAKRNPNLPYTNAYQALTMASIVEKETGQKSERNMIAGVFVNRLRKGMLLQTDPTVIYGLGDRYDGKIYKRDLETDTPYNTYTRSGLPPTPIALAGQQSLNAALAPASTEALYFVSRGDGTSKFSDNLTDHNRAVNQYQR
jgi:UPF0755 protein